MSSATPSLGAFVAEHAPPAVAIEPRIERVALLLFEIEGGLYAAQVKAVREVVRADAITRIPQAPRHVRGVQSVRGQIIPVLELRTRLGLSPATVTEASRVVIGELGQRLVGLLVDRAHQVVQVPRANLLPPPAEVHSPLAGYLCGTVQLDRQVALLLDLDSLLVLPRPEASTP